MELDVNPLLLYLDQKDISFLAKGKTDRATADELRHMVAAGEIAVVMSFAHIVETALAPERLGAQIANVVDTTLKPRHWLYDFDELSRAEVAFCLETDIGASPEPVRPFHGNPMTRGLLVGPEMTFGQAVGLARANRAHGASSFWNSLQQYPRLRERGRAQCDNDPIQTTNIQKFIYDSMPTQTRAGRTLSDECRSDYAAKLDVDRCPAISLWMTVLEVKSHNKRAPIGRSEGPDLLHATAVPYCDITTLDAQMYSVVSLHRTARCFSDRIARNVGEAVARLKG